MRYAALLPLLVLEQASCSALFGTNDSPAIDAGFQDASALDASGIDASGIDAGYSLEAVWQTPTDTALGLVAVGPDQRLAFAGQFAGTVKIDDQSLESMGQLDLFVMHLNADTGTPMDFKPYGGGASEFVTSISMGPNNDLVVAGGILGVNATLGGSNYEGAGSAVPTGFVARYDPSLDHIWSLFFDSNANNSSVQGLSAENNVYTCGSYAGSLNLPQTAGGTSQLPGLDGLAAFYSKYNDNGTFSSGQLTFSGQGEERCSVVVNDGLGSAFIAGIYSEAIDFSTTLNFDGDAGPPPAAPNQTNFFVGRIDHDTTLQWIVSIPGNTMDFPVMSGALGANNQLVLISEFKGSALVPDLDVTLTAANDEDIALFILSPVDGEVLVAKSFPSLGTDRAAGLAVGPDGQIALVGRFTGSIDFGGELLESEGLDDIFIAVFDRRGEHLWSKRFGTTTADQGLSAAFDASGALYVSVRYQNGIDFGLGPLAGLNSGAVVKFE